MTTYYRRWWAQIVVAGWVALGACSLCQGASDTDELDGLDAAHIGRYFADVAAPDDLTTTKKGATLKVTDGDWDAELWEDDFVIELSAKNGATAVFKGRTTDYGCLYTVNGVYVGGSGTGTPPTWTNEFEEENTPRIKLEINGAGTSDDIVLPCDNGATLYVWVLNTTGSVSVTVSPAADPDGSLSVTPSSVSVTGGGSPGEAALKGLTPGWVKITASATVNGNQISNWIRAKVVTVAGRIHPDDNFDSRSYSRLGVGETGDLLVDVPPGTDLAPLRPISWATSNPAALGVMCNTDTGVGRFTAGGQRADVTLTLTYNGGSITYNVEITPPTGFVFVRQPDTGLKHDAGFASIGFRANVFYRPTDVSFHYIQDGEDTCTANIANGNLQGWYQERWPNGLIHSANGPVGISTGNITTGCQMNNYDWIFDKSTSWSAGKTGWYIWNIPQRWTLDSGSTWHEYGEARQRSYTDTNGTMTIEKAGAGPFSKALNDPDDEPTWSW